MRIERSPAHGMGEAAAVSAGLQLCRCDWSPLARVLAGRCTPDCPLVSPAPPPAAAAGGTCG